MINPGSVFLSGVMMLEYFGWDEAANLITNGLSKAIAVSYTHLTLPTNREV